MSAAKKSTSFGSLPMKFPTATGFPERNLKGRTMDGANAPLRRSESGEALQVIFSSPTTSEGDESFGLSDKFATGECLTGSSVEEAVIVPLSGTSPPCCPSCDVESSISSSSSSSSSTIVGITPPVVSIDVVEMGLPVSMLDILGA